MQDKTPYPAFNFDRFTSEKVWPVVTISREATRVFVGEIDLDMRHRD